MTVAVSQSGRECSVCVNVGSMVSGPTGAPPRSLSESTVHFVQSTVGVVHDADITAAAPVAVDVHMAELVGAAHVRVADCALGTTRALLRLIC